MIAVPIILGWLNYGRAAFHLNGLGIHGVTRKKKKAEEIEMQEYLALAKHKLHGCYHR